MKTHLWQLNKHMSVVINTHFWLIDTLSNFIWHGFTVHLMPMQVCSKSTINGLFTHTLDRGHLKKKDLILRKKTVIHI